MDSVGCPILSMRLCAHLGVRFVSGFVLSQSQSCQHLGGGARAMALRPKASLLSSEPRTPLPPGPTLIGGHHLSLLQRAGGLWDVSQDWELDGGGGRGLLRPSSHHRGAASCCFHPSLQPSPPPVPTSPGYLCFSSSNPVLPFAPSLYPKPALGRAVSCLLQRTPAHWCCALYLPDL